MISIFLVYFTALCGIIKKRSRLIFILLFVICFIFAWLTDDQYDYRNYELGYDQVATGGLTRFELGYVFLMELGNIFGLTYFEFRGVFSFLFLFILFRSISFYTQEINIPISLGIVFPLLYVFPIQRFLGGMALVLYAIKYLNKTNLKNLSKYTCLIVFAGLLHSSCFFFLIAPLCKLVKKRWDFLFVSFICACGFVLLAKLGVLNKVIALFPIGASVNKILLSKNTANMNGIIAFSILVVLIVIPGFLSVIWYKKNVNEKEFSFMQIVFALNVLSFYTVAFRVYSIGVERLLYIFMLINYVAVANTLSSRNISIRKYNKYNFYLVLVSTICLFSITFLELFVFSPSLRDLIFWVQFRNNPIFNSMNLLFIG